MDNQIYIGDLTEDTVDAQRYWKVPKTYRSLLFNIGRLLGHESFIKHVKVDALETCDKVYGTIIERRHTLTDASGKRAKLNYERKHSETVLKDLTLKRVQSFPYCNGIYILEDTIETHTCNEKVKCPDCEGNGICSHCEGAKHVICPVCQGEKLCTNCKGSGKIPCNSCGQRGKCSCCGGTGEVECEDCDGDGWVWEDIECYQCNGTGDFQLRNGDYVPCKACRGTGIYNQRKVNCNHCDATGKVTCDECGGDGVCVDCSGDGYLDCPECGGSRWCGNCEGRGKVECSYCKASGVCSTCEGTGQVMCSICEGSGYYQTYRGYRMRYSVDRIQLGNQDLSNLFPEGKSTSVYSGSPLKVEFSKLTIDDEELNDILDSHSQKEYRDYKDKIFSTDGQLKVSEKVCIDVEVTLSRLGCQRLTVNFADKEFVFHIVGENRAVYCNKKPTKLDFIRAMF